ncbi:PAS domain-containing protein [Candidatus Fukatsuia symbiotica]|nr:PAS domain-containing protein [Candidatus Fukatsuia symbiotica]MEA9444741.1 PAS domain-containing protein [Candidatus Fukatsuia symbiotica]
MVKSNSKNATEKKPKLFVAEPQIPLNLATGRSLWDHLVEPLAIKDRESRYLYANPAHIELYNLPAEFKIEGMFDNEIPLPMAEFSAKFQTHDRLVEQTMQPIPVLETHLYGREKKLQAYIFDKRPFTDSTEGCIGTIFSGKKLEICSINDHVKMKMPSSLMLTQPDQFFTHEEFEIIFFLLQLIPTTEIAKRLNLPYHNIENNARRIYRKAAASSFDDFKSFCEEKGYDCYIPAKFLHINHTIER